MGAIIWINGAFGSGKTQTAWELHRRLPGSFVFDPENAGYYMRENLPAELAAGDFQELPLWRRFNYDMLSYLAERYRGVILVPMTVTDPAKFDEIAGRLRREGRSVEAFVLWVSEKELRRRLRTRGEGKGSWAAAQIPRCLSGLQSPGLGRRLETDGRTVPQAAELLAQEAGLALLPGARSGAVRLWQRLKTQLRHVRWLR